MIEITRVTAPTFGVNTPPGHCDGLNPVFAGPGHPHASRLAHGFAGFAHPDGTVVTGGAVVAGGAVVTGGTVVTGGLVVVVGGLVVVVVVVVVVVLVVVPGVNTMSAQ